MTYDSKDIADLTAFASQNDDDDWEGAEPTQPQRPSSLRPPPALQVDGDPVQGFRNGVLIAAGLWAGLFLVGFWAMSC